MYDTKIDSVEQAAYASAGQLAEAVRSRRLTSRELLEHFLGRQSHLDGPLNLIVTIDAERASKEAEAADAAVAAGNALGPLHGVPMTVKDSFSTAGMRTTSGAPELSDHVPAADADPVRRLREAGAVIWGKTNLPIYAGDVQSYNEVFGRSSNPWDVSRTVGGSSGGAAGALAAGFTPLELGSDIGGSIRNPAHSCGIYGHKPTWGILPPRGHAMPGILAPSDISVIGPLARAPEDLALALDALAGPDLLDAAGWRLELPAPTKTTLKDFRVAAWLDDPLAPVDAEVGDRLQAAIEALAKAGATVDDTARPAIDPARSHAIFQQLMWGVTSARAPAEDFEQALADAAALAADADDDGARITRATVQYHRDWIAANEQRTHLRWAWAEFFADWDVLICPISVTPPFPHDHEPDQTRRRLNVNRRPVPYLQQMFWAGLVGLVYLPATVAPVGPAASGLPVGAQIVGPAFADRTTIAFADLLGREIGGFTPPPGYD